MAGRILMLTLWLTAQMLASTLIGVHLKSVLACWIPVRSCGGTYLFPDMFGSLVGVFVGV